MDKTKVMVITFLITSLRKCMSASSLEGQVYFKKIRNYGNSLASEDILSSYIVNSEVECSLKCSDEHLCVGYNYRITSPEHEINCQLTTNTAIKIKIKSAGHGQWVFYQDTDTLSTYQWTLIARFSNKDFKNWMHNASFWYDRVIPYGEVDNPSGNTDMISKGFWEMKGRDIKITRSDDSSHAALLQTTSNCLQGGTFRSKITSFGNFRNNAVWADQQCRGSCPVIYGGQYKTTSGFEQHSCSSSIQKGDNIGFWCDWSAGDGAVMMIGGGGKSCKRADHGIGITELNAAKFGSRYGFDFGSDANVTQCCPSTYSLNLWVR